MFSVFRKDLASEIQFVTQANRKNQKNKRQQKQQKQKTTKTVVNNIVMFPTNTDIAQKCSYTTLLADSVTRQMIRFHTISGLEGKKQRKKLNAFIKTVHKLIIEKLVLRSVKWKRKLSSKCNNKETGERQRTRSKSPLNIKFSSKSVTSSSSSF